MIVPVCSLQTHLQHDICAIIQNDSLLLLIVKFLLPQKQQRKQCDVTMDRGEAHISIANCMLCSTLRTVRQYQQLWGCTIFYVVSVISKCGHAKV